MTDPDYPMTDAEAQRIVNAVLHELDGRRGFKVIVEIRNEDPPTYRELHDTLQTVVKEAFVRAKERHDYFSPPEAE